jgi:hypothetical protein
MELIYSERVQKLIQQEQTGSFIRKCKNMKRY